MLLKIEEMPSWGRAAVRMAKLGFAHGGQDASCSRCLAHGVRASMGFAKAAVDGTVGHQDGEYAWSGAWYTR